MNRSLFITLMASSLATAADFQIQRSSVQTREGNLHWAQSRPALIPGEPRAQPYPFGQDTLDQA